MARLVLVLGVTTAAPMARAADPPAAAAPRKAAPAPEPAQLNMLYGDDHMFGVITPKGWKLDNQSGRASGLRTVLYPLGQKWSTAKTVMYVNSQHRQKGGPALPLGAMVARDSLEFRRKHPGGSVKAAPAIRTGSQKVAPVRYFSSDGGAPSEAVAYVEEDELVMLLVLSSRSSAEFKKALPAFSSLVGSYMFVTGGLQPAR